MPTVRDEISRTLVQIGALASGETPSDEEAQDILVVLNEMVDSWSAEPGGQLFKIEQALRAVTMGKQDYTIGPGAAQEPPVAVDYEAQRPVLIQSAAAVHSSGLRVPMEILTAAKWNAILERASTGQMPRGLYCDYAFPIAGLHIHPVPSVNGVFVETQSWNALTGFSTLDDLILFPPGHLEAIRLNLAIRLPEFAEPNVLAVIAPQAARALQVVRSLNAQYLLAIQAGMPLPGMAPQVQSNSPVQQ